MPRTFCPISMFLSTTAPLITGPSSSLINAILYGVFLSNPEGPVWIVVYVTISPLPEKVNFSSSVLPHSHTLRGGKCIAPHLHDVPTIEYLCLASLHDIGTDPICGIFFTYRFGSLLTLPYLLTGSFPKILTTAVAPEPPMLRFNPFSAPFIGLKRSPRSSLTISPTCRT